MTPDERSLLQRFLQDLVQTRGVTKDAEADGMINDALRTSPDACYLLVQRRKEPRPPPLLNGPGPG